MGCIVHHNFTTSSRSCRKVEVEGVEAVAEVDKVECGCQGSSAPYFTVEETLLHFSSLFLSQCSRKRTSRFGVPLKVICCQFVVATSVPSSFLVIAVGCCAIFGG